MKECKRCRKTKPLDGFHKKKTGKRGRTAYCKICVSELGKDWRAKNTESEREKKEIWKKNNPERHKGYVLKSVKKYLATPQGRLHNSVAARIRRTIKGGKGGQRLRSIVGYTGRQLMVHLEGQFRDGMNWENYGKWEIDHRRPICSFRYKTVNDIEFRDCWALENLQPLWRKENRSKGGKYLET